MTSMTEAHAYACACEQDEPQPPPCPTCVQAERKAEQYEEQLSEVVLDTPQADGSPALMRCSPALPDVVAKLVEVVKWLDRKGEAYIGEAQWCAWGPECPNLMRAAREALKAAGVEPHKPKT